MSETKKSLTTTKTCGDIAIPALSNVRTTGTTRDIAIPYPPNVRVGGFTSRQRRNYRKSHTSHRRRLLGENSGFFWHYGRFHYHYDCEGALDYNFVTQGGSDTSPPDWGETISPIYSSEDEGSIEPLPPFAEAGDFVPQGKDAFASVVDLPEKPTFAPTSVSDILNNVSDTCSKGREAVTEAGLTLDAIRNFVDSIVGTTEKVMSNRDEIVSRIEGLVLLYTGVSTCTTFGNFLAVLGLYVKTWTKTSFMGFATEMINKHVNISLKCNPGEDIESSCFSFSDLFVKWRQYRSHPLARCVSTLTVMGIVAGMLPEYGESTMTREVYDLLDAQASKNQLSSAKMMDMVASLVLYSRDYILPALKAKDVSILFLGDKADDADAEFLEIMRAKKYVEHGMFDRFEETKYLNVGAYTYAIEKCGKKFNDALKFTKVEVIRQNIMRKVERLNALLVEIDIKTAGDPLIRQAFCFKLFGESSVGKSKLAMILMSIAARIYGFKLNNTTFACPPPGEVKYDSNVTPATMAALLDDLPTLHPQFNNNESPLDRIFRMVNNIPSTILKAGVEDKGNMKYNLQVVGITTNEEWLGALSSLICPAALLRRMMHLKVELDENCMDEYGGPKPELMNQTYPDIWKITVKKVILLRGDAKAYRIVDVGTMRLPAFLEYFKKAVNEHVSTQRNVVKTSEIYFSDTYCSNGFLCREGERCHICKETLTPEEELEDAIMKRILSGRRKSSGLVESEPYKFGQLSFSEEDYEKLVEDGSFVIHEDDPLFPLSKNLFSASYLRVAEKCAAVRTMVGDLLATHRKEVAAVGIVAVASAALAYWKLHHSMTNEFVAATGMADPPLPTVKKENPWKKVVISPVDFSEESKTTTPENLIKAVHPRIAIIEYAKFTSNTEVESTKHFCCAVPMKEDFWLVPGHIFRDGDTYKVWLRTEAKDTFGGKSGIVCVDDSCWSRIPGEDLMVVRFEIDPNKDISKWLPVTKPDLAGKSIHVIGKKLDATKVAFTSVAMFPMEGKIVGDDTACRRTIYNTPFDTYLGMCMYVAVSTTSGAIVGFHTAGDMKRRGALSMLTLSEFEAAAAKLRRKSTALSAGIFPRELCGRDINVLPTVHYKNSVHFMPDDKFRHGEVLGGSDMPRMKFNSGVVKTPISDKVEEIMGLKRKHGPPRKAPRWRDHQRDLEITSGADYTYVPKLMDQCVDEEVAFLDRAIRNGTGYKDVKPLPLVYAINGVDGVPGYERTDFSTSSGIPLKCIKRDLVYMLPNPPPGLQVAYLFTKESGFDVYYVLMIRQFKKGQRVYLLYDSPRKDEAVKWEKDKQRIFTTLNFVAVTLIRQYFLPLIKVIQDNWKETGVAVGINAHGKDWNALFEHLTEGDPSGFVAGDYSSFDKNTSPAITMRVMEIFLRLAEKAGYDEEDLTIMRGLATEIVYPVVEWDGAWVAFKSLIPSGVPITVHLQSIHNKLDLRYCNLLRSLELDIQHEPLETRSRFFVYGDDVVMRVREKFRAILDHVIIARLMARLGVVFTLADKSTEERRFEDLSGVTFLRRIFHRHENGNMTAPLEEDSISKQLHNWMRRRNTQVDPYDVAVGNCRNAVYEYYQHGKAVFDVRRAQLVRVLTEVLDPVTHTPLIDRLPNGLPTWEECEERYASS